MQGMLEQVKVLSFPVEGSQTAHDRNRWEMAVDGRFRPWSGCGHNHSRCSRCSRCSRSRTLPPVRAEQLPAFPSGRGLCPVGGAGITWCPVPPPGPSAMFVPSAGPGGGGAARDRDWRQERSQPLPAGRDRPPQSARERRQFPSRGLEPSQVALFSFPLLPRSPLAPPPVSQIPGALPGVPWRSLQGAGGQPRPDPRWERAPGAPQSRCGWRGMWRERDPVTPGRRWLLWEAAPAGALPVADPAALPHV